MIARMNANWRLSTLEWEISVKMTSALLKHLVVCVCKNHFEITDLLKWVG